MRIGVDIQLSRRDIERQQSGGAVESDQEDLQELEIEEGDE